MIDYGGDGFRQHFRALVYYSDYLKNIFRTLLSEKKIVIPRWDFVIGEGSDILTTLHYYGIGDIFTFFSCICPKEFLYFYYDGATLARMFFSGIVFSSFCFYLNKKNKLIILGSALLYAFCPFAISNLSSHVFFISAMVFFPLILLGVEKIIHGDKPFLLSLAVMLSSLSNIYFFYMNVLSTVVYVAVRLLFIDELWAERLKTVGKIFIYSFLGVLMSAVIFIPEAYAIISSSRFDGKIISPLLYELSYYEKMFEGLSFGGYMFYGGFTVLGLISLISLFTRREKPELILLFVLGTVFACIPFFGKLYNALIYPSPRWIYAFSMLISFIIVSEFEDIRFLKSRLIYIAVFLLLYYSACIFINREVWQIHAMYLAIAIIAVVVLFFVNNKQIINLICLGVLIFGISFDILYNFSPRYWNTAGNGTPIEVIQNTNSEEHSVFAFIDDDSFYRYSGSDLKTNQSIHGKESSTQFYWSVSNDNVIEFRKYLGLSDHNNHHYDSYDGRFSLNALASVKYQIENDKNFLPYGYNQMRKISTYNVYKSDYYLDLFYGYDSYIPEQEWKKMPVERKNESLSQGAVLNEKIEGFDYESIKSTSKELDYYITLSEGIDVRERTVIVEKNGSSILLNSSNVGEGEYYFIIEGLYSDTNSNIIISYKNVDKILFYKGPYHFAYPDKHDFMINLGYLEELNEPIIVSFPDAGVFEYSDIRIVYQPLEDQIAYINRLYNIKIDDLMVQEDHIQANITADKDKILCLSVPYSEGWKVYVDGEERELYRCNIQYMCLKLEKGSHFIELKYNTPLLKTGVIVSGISSLLFIVLWLKNKNYTKITRNEKE